MTSQSDSKESKITRDEAQKKVISLDQGYHLVLASAGCGKTDILAERVKRAIQNGQNPKRMLCLTFTNRAARGMKGRISEMTECNLNDLYVGNIHRFCSKFLFDNDIISQSSAILDEQDAFSVISSKTHLLGLQEDESTDLSNVSFELRNCFTAILQLQHLMSQYRHNHPRGVIMCKISDYKDSQRSSRYFSPEQFARLCKETGCEISIKSILKIYDEADQLACKLEYSSQTRELLSLMAAARLYEKYKMDNQLVDFDDLLILTYSALEDGKVESPRYNWIQVDEVQDLNPLQFAILDRMTDNRHVTVYLGDEQQAIYSFIGAKLSTLGILKERCGVNIHHLEKCYRSPKYLLDVLNDYALHELNAEPKFLPEPTNLQAPEYGDLIILYSKDSNTAVKCSVKEALSHTEGRTAILVNSNRDADLLSDVLKDIPHFKISGTDVFSSEPMKMMIAHLNVVYDKINFLAWARILYQTGVIKSLSVARELVMALKKAAVSPEDFLLFPDSCYVKELIKTWQTKEIVVFDTETTGLDIYNDDIVQIAASKYFKGKKVGSLNIFLETNRNIPQFLGNIPNPLVSEYASQPHVQRSQGLYQFIEFAKGCTLMGHNVEFDYNILIQNCLRDLPEVKVDTYLNQRFDTLALSKLLFPQIPNYKLGALVDRFRLGGENSHLADADIEATYNLAAFCLAEAQNREGDIEKMLLQTKDIAKKFRDRYAELYTSARNRLYKLESGEAPIITELKSIYATLKNKHGNIKTKIGLVFKFLEREFSTSGELSSLYLDLNKHLMDLNTFKESDLCDESIAEDRLFIATVHKAKGLEFENVIVHGCVDGVYPFFATQNEPDARFEDARKLYVALSRAKKRLTLIVYNEKVVKSVKTKQYYRFPASPSPFLSHILSNHPFVTVQE